jgi:hypothetical protein
VAIGIIEWVVAWTIRAAIPAEPHLVATILAWLWGVFHTAYSSVFAAMLYHGLRASKEGIGQASADDLSSFLKTTGVATDRTFGAIFNKCFEIYGMMEGKNSFSDLPTEQRRTLRTDLYLVSESLGKLVKQKKLTDDEAKEASALKARMDKTTKFIPDLANVVV